MTICVFKAATNIDHFISSYMLKQASKQALLDRIPLEDPNHSQDPHFLPLDVTPNSLRYYLA